MTPENPGPTQQPGRNPEAAEHVAEAHRILNGLREEIDRHPDLDKAIANLEMALSILATNTGGML